MTAERVRAFICFEIDRQMAASLGSLIAEARQFGERISWAQPEKIHLTLKFLGDVDSQQIEQITQILSNIAADKRGFEIAFDRLGAFPDFHRPRIFWVGASELPPVLTALVAELETTLSTLGFQKEKRAYTPHLTLGRVKGAPCPETAAFLKDFQLERQSVHCSEIVLMQSDLQPSGAVYTPLATCKLQPVKHA